MYDVPCHCWSMRLPIMNNDHHAFTVSMHLGSKTHSLAPSTKQTDSHCSCIGALEIEYAKLLMYVVHFPSTSNREKWFDSIPSTVCREPWKPQDVLLLVDQCWPMLTSYHDRNIVKLPSLSPWTERAAAPIWSLAWHGGAELRGDCAAAPSYQQRFETAFHRSRHGHETERGVTILIWFDNA